MYTPLVREVAQNKHSTRKNVAVFLLVGALMWFLGYNMGEKHHLSGAEGRIAEPVAEPLNLDVIPSVVSQKLSEFQSSGREVAIAHPVDHDGTPQWVLDTIALGERAMRERGWTEAEINEIALGNPSPGQKKRLGYVERVCKKATGSASIGKKSTCERLVNKGVKYFSKLIEVDENAVCKQPGGDCSGDFPTRCQHSMIDWCSQKSDSWHWTHLTKEFTNCRNAWETQALSISSATAQTIMLFMSGGTLTAVKTAFKGFKDAFKAIKGGFKLKFIMGSIKKAAIAGVRNAKKKIMKHLKRWSMENLNKKKAFEYLLMFTSEAAANQEARSILDTMKDVGKELLEDLDPTGMVGMTNFLNSFKTCDDIKPSQAETFSDGDLTNLAKFMEGKCGIPEVSDPDFEQFEQRGAGCCAYLDSDCNHTF